MNGVTPPEAEFVQPLTVMVLLAVPLVALFHQTLTAPFVPAAWLTSIVQVLPPVSSSTTVGAAVAPRLVTPRTKISSVKTPELITSVNPVVNCPPGVEVLVPIVIAMLDCCYHKTKAAPSS
jgi:hypothetical protein